VILSGSQFRVRQVANRALEGPVLGPISGGLVLGLFLNKEEPCPR
jgi:hypothetical protein